MRKSFVILTAVAALAIYAGLRAYNHVPDAGDGRIPLPPGFVDTPTEFDTTDSQPLDSLADALIFKCIALGVIDTTKPTKNDDGKRCATVLCGEKTANAEFPEAESLIRECYKRHFPS